MIKNISYNDSNVADEINSLVGNAYTWFDRIKMGGNGSPRFKIILASENIKNIVSKDDSIKYCNIELRPKGIIVNFRKILKAYAWAVPYHQLTIFKNKNYYSLYGAKEFLRIQNNHKDSINQTFIERLLEIRSSYFQQLAILN